jgi:hypothetical protein
LKKGIKPGYRKILQKCQKRFREEYWNVPREKKKHSAVQKVPLAILILNSGRIFILPREKLRVMTSGHSFLKNDWKWVVFDPQNRFKKVYQNRFRIRNSKLSRIIQVFDIFWKKMRIILFSTFLSEIVIISWLENLTGSSPTFLIVFSIKSSALFWPRFLRSFFDSFLSLFLILFLIHFLTSFLILFSIRFLILFFD